MNKLEILKGARELLSDPNRWTKGWFARNSQELACSEFDEDAKCFCAIGALFKASGTTKWCGERHMAEKALTFTIEDKPLDKFNDADSTTHEDVLCVFDKTIERLELAP